MALADQKIAGLSLEVKKLKDEQLQCIKNNEYLQKQVSDFNFYNYIPVPVYFHQFYTLNYNQLAALYSN